MVDLIEDFISGRYAPHGYCLLWQPELIWSHVTADLLIAAAYFSIPFALIHFVRSRRDIEFGGMIWLFALFILACGTTHLMNIWNLWHGDYGVEAVVKLVTAAASVPTAILLWRLIPQALAIPSPTQLQLANADLAERVRERDAAVSQLQAEIAVRERAEAALLQAQKIDAVGQLTGGIAHDFNNLLQVVSGNLELIKARPADTERVTRWAENAGKGVDLGTRLTGKLLAFSRIQRLARQAVDINALLDGARDLIQASIGPLVSWELRLDSTICRALGDKVQLELTVLNLAINARDAMPNGGHLMITTRQVDIADGEHDLEAGSYVELSMIDSGVGMSREVLDRALEPFFTTKGVGSGTGLGLSMAFGIARQSSGTLLLTSEVDLGTTVCILLPCVTQDGAADDEDDGKAIDLVDPQAGSGLRAMIVDDDDGVRAFVTEALEGIGMTCHSFDSPAAALDGVGSIAPDIVFLDFAMPNMNGAELAQALRPAIGNARIVFMTGYADSAALDNVVTDERDVLRKPFSAGTLCRAALRPA